MADYVTPYLELPPRDELAARLGKALTEVAWNRNKARNLARALKEALKDGNKD